MNFLDLLPKDAIGLRLYRHGKHDLIACEAVVFKEGRAAVDTVLRRAALSGRVEVGGVVVDHFADVLIDASGTWSATVALDADSYRALKNHWMRCKVDDVSARISEAAGSR